MNSILFVTLLSLAVLSTATTYGANFSLEISKLKYKLAGYGSIDMMAFQGDNSNLVAAFNGTFTDDASVTYVSEGTMTGKDPIISNLDNVAIAGSNKGGITYTGKLKVSIWDILKTNIPIKGNLKFSNGKEGDFKGTVSQPALDFTTVEF